MSLFAIADTHLSFGTDKPMDTFAGWSDYTERLEKNWNKLVDERDYVIIAGDVSWAIDFDELMPDFEFLNKLKGTKIILKGNHDFWWNTVTKLNKFSDENNFTTIKFLNNNSYDFDSFSVCGSRGWFFDSEEMHDEKILSRELGRIRLSLDSAGCDNKIVFLHYPPVTTNDKCDEILNLLKEYGIKKCYYGHLHGVAAKFAVEDTIDDISFKCISADRLGFTPYLINKF